MAQAPDLEVAIGLVEDAALVALRHFGTALATQIKADGSVVTVADLEVEDILRERLHEYFPDDAVLGEETGSSGAGPRTWLIDPIDGTAQFAVGDPNWRIHLCMEVDGNPVTAVVAVPAAGLLLWASEGEGAFVRDAETVRRLAVSAVSDPSLARVSAFPRALLDTLGLSEHSRPATFPLLAMVLGELDVFVNECCHPWDHAPWIRIIEEAGGRFTAWGGGRRSDMRGGLFSNGALHRDFEPLLSLQT